MSFENKGEAPDARRVRQGQHQRLVARVTARPLQRAVCEKILTEKASGAKADRPELRLGEKRVSAEVVEQVLSRAIDELEPTLTRNGYDSH